MKSIEEKKLKIKALSEELLSLFSELQELEAEETTEKAGVTSDFFGDESSDTGLFVLSGPKEKVRRKAEDLLGEKNPEIGRLQAENRLQKVVLDGSDRMLFVCDSEEQLVYFNQAAENYISQMTGRKLIAGKKLTACLPADFVPEVKNHFEKALAGRESRSECSGMFGIEERRISMSCKPVFEQDRFSGAILVLSDATADFHLTAHLEEQARIIDDIINEVYIFDRTSLRFLYANQGASLGSSFSKDELLRMTPVDLVPELSEKSFRKMLEPLRTGQKESFRSNVRHQRKDGSLYEVSGILQNSFFEGRKTYTAVITDRTEENRNKAEITKLALVAQKTNNGVLIIDRIGRIEWVNEAFIRMSGYSSEELIGETPAGLLQGSETDLSTIFALQKAIRKGENYACELLNYTKKGHRYWVRSDLQVLTDSEGKTLQFILLQTDITSAKLFHEQLDFQAKIIDCISEAVTLVDEENEIIFFNSGAEKLYGYTKEEAIGQSVRILFPENKLLPLQADLSWPEIGKGKSVSGEFQRRRKNGEIIWVYLELSRFTDTDGQTLGLVGVSHDITIRRETAERLKASEMHLQSVFEASSQAYFLADENQKLINYNRAAKDIFGDYLDRPMHTSDKLPLVAALLGDREYETHFEKALNGNKSILTLYAEIPGKWFDIEYFPARDQHNTIYGVALVTDDVTDKKKIELLLKRSYQDIRNFRNALNLSTLLCITDTEGRIVEINGPFCRASDYDPEELFGKTADLVTDFFREKNWKSLLVEVENKKSFYRGELQHRSKNGQFFWTDSVINPVHDSNGKVYRYLILSYLITDRKKAENDRKILVNKVLNINANLRQFSYITSHNLRSSVANIIGLLSLYSDEESENKENEFVISNLRKASEQLDGVIFDMNTILEVRDDMAEKQEKTSLSELVERVKTGLSRMIEERNVRIIIKAENDEFWTVKSYAESILHNLISNSIKYRSPERQPLINVRMSETEKNHILTIQDNGLGIDTENFKDRLFRLYERFHLHEEGRGMGLFMVKTQVEALGGSIDAKGIPGQGTIFRIKFPKHRLSR